MLGMARRAGRLSFGHDAVKDALRNGEAETVIFACDASDRLKDELTALADINSVTAVVTGFGSSEFGKSTGMKSIAVISVNDAGFAKRITELMTQEE